MKKSAGPREKAAGESGAAASVQDTDDYNLGLLWDMDPDIRSLKSLILFGLKGMAAYAYHALMLGASDETVNQFFLTGLREIAKDGTVESLLPTVLKVGEVNLTCMAMLDAANTGTYGTPIPVSVPLVVERGPFIVVTGHDLKDLELLLKQTEGKGVNIYTHGEMLPGHGYEKLNRYSHLVGNFGGAWQDQQKEFDDLPGCILMTTNCLMRPRESYKDRIYSTNVVGWDGIKYIPKNADGTKDFSEIIEHALQLGGFSEDQELKKIMTGFAREAVLSHAEHIVSSVREERSDTFPHRRMRRRKAWPQLLH